MIYEHPLRNTFTKAKIISPIFDITKAIKKSPIFGYGGSFRIFINPIDITKSKKYLHFFQVGGIIQQ
jgi:hypothetical protein